MTILPTIIIVLTLLGASLAVAPAYHYPAYLKHAFLQIGVLLLTLCWLWKRLRSPVSKTKSWMRYYLPEFLLCAYACWAGISILWSGLPYLAWLGLAPILYRLAWALLAGSFLKKQSQLKAILAAIVITGALAALIAVLQALAQTQGSPLTREAFVAKLRESIPWLLGHRNFMAMFLISPICIALLTAITALKNRAAPQINLLLATICLLATGLMLFVFAQCYSNGGWVGLGAALLLLALQRLPRKARRLAISGLLTAAGVVAIWFSQSKVQSDFRAYVVENGHYPEQATRYFMLQGAWDMFRERPLLGWGPDTFLNYFPRFRPLEALRYGVMGHLSLHPHNEAMYIAIQFGAIGLALLAAALALIFRRVWRRIASSTEPAAFRWPMLALAAGTIGMLVHGLFDVGLRFWAPAGLFWLQVGILLAVARGAPNAEISADIIALPLKRFSPSFIAYFALAALATAALAWQTCWEGQASEYLCGRGDERSRRGDHEGALALYQEALSRSRYTTDYVLLHDVLGKELVLADKPREEAIEVYQELRRLAPGLGDADLALAQLYKGEYRAAVMRNDADADKYLQLAAAYYRSYIVSRPDKPIARAELAEILLLSGGNNFDEAFALLKAALQRRPKDSFARFLLGRCLLDKGNAPAAESQFISLAEDGAVRVEDNLSLFLLAPGANATHKHFLREIPGTAKIISTAYSWAATAAEAQNKFEIARDYRNIALAFGAPSANSGLRQ